MQIAILGATSQIARDLILAYSKRTKDSLTLLARRPQAVEQWLSNVGLTSRYAVLDIASFGKAKKFDAVLNFIGVGNPAQTAAMGASVLDITQYYEDLVLAYLKHYPLCRYIFLSSGAAYGSGFDEPANIHAKSTMAINNLQPQDWYAVAKLYAECRHRALPDLPIIDIRVFNYFSHSQDLEARFLITDILRAIREKKIFSTSSDNIFRDFIHPDDFYQLVTLILNAAPANLALDCYSLEPLDKFTLLENMRRKYGLQYEINNTSSAINATGHKSNYYSIYKRAADFGYAPTYTAMEAVFKEIDSIAMLEQ